MRHIVLAVIIIVIIIVVVVVIVVVIIVVVVVVVVIIIVIIIIIIIIRDSSVGIALGCYGLDDRGSRVRFPRGLGSFSLHHSVQNGSGAHPASYPMGTRDSSLGVKVTGA
jgi:hypothetical protein